MGALANLLQRTAPVTTVATSATLAQNRPKVSQESQESQWVEIENTAIAIRTRLLALAEQDGVAVDLIHQRVDDVIAEYQHCTDDELSACLRAWETAARMDAGLAPPGYTKAVQCPGCGPVLLWPTSPDEVTACPWCFRRKAGKVIPRPQGKHP